MAENLPYLKAVLNAVERSTQVTAWPCPEQFAARIRSRGSRLSCSPPKETTDQTQPEQINHVENLLQAYATIENLLQIYATIANGTCQSCQKKKVGCQQTYVGFSCKNCHASGAACIFPLKMKHREPNTSPRKRRKVQDGKFMSGDGSEEGCSDCEAPKRTPLNNGYDNLSAGTSDSFTMMTPGISQNMMGRTDVSDPSCSAIFAQGSTVPFNSNTPRPTQCHGVCSWTPPATESGYFSGNQCGPHIYPTPQSIQTPASESNVDRRLLGYYSDQSVP